MAHFFHINIEHPGVDQQAIVEYAGEDLELTEFFGGQLQSRKTIAEDDLKEMLQILVPGVDFSYLDGITSDSGLKVTIQHFEVSVLKDGQIYRYPIR